MWSLSTEMRNACSHYMQPQDCIGSKLTSVQDKIASIIN